jgi:hypothetical protein
MELTMRKIFILILLVLAVSCYGSDWYVYSGATGLGDGTSKSDAWTKLANVKADSIVDGDNIYIYAGDYTNDSLEVTGFGSSTNYVKFIGIGKVLIKVQSHEFSATQYYPSVFFVQTAGCYLEFENITFYWHNPVAQVHLFSRKSSEEPEMDVIFRNCYFLSNTNTNGVVLAIAFTTCKLYNCFAYNARSSTVSLKVNGDAEFINTTFYNWSFFQGVGGKTWTIRDCVFDYLSTGPVNAFIVAPTTACYNVILHGYNTTGFTGTNIVQDDPEISVAGSSYSDYEFSLSSTSPCINGGVNGLDIGRLLRLGIETR